MSAWERELPETEARVAREQACLILDASGQVQHLSRGFQELVGCSSAGTSGSEPPWPWWPPDEREFLVDQLRFVVDGLAARLGVRSLSLPLLRGDGEQVTATCTYHPIRSEGGRLRWHLMAVRWIPPEEDPEVGDRAARLEAGLQRIARTLSEVGIAKASASRRVPDAGSSVEETLSRREGQVMELLLAGKRSQEISRELFISRHTARNHIHSIYEKLDVHSQVELLRRFASHERASL